ncbi:hypothetical protein HRbin19_00518 [bacterium HR19]|nr:hypothetical protein HRbin19_00518 [bacterium HR19]
MKKKLNKKSLLMGVFLVGLSAVALSLTQSCGPIERGEEVGSGGGGGIQPTQCPDVSYSKDVYPMLNQKCSGCHTSGPGPSFISGNASNDYNKIKARAEEKEGEESKLLQKASGKVQHGGGAVIPEGSEEYTKLKCWIEAGAPNN